MANTINSHLFPKSSAILQSPAIKALNPSFFLGLTPEVILFLQSITLYLKAANILAYE